MNVSAPMTDNSDIENFVYSGRVIFTLVSKKTENRFTFRVRKADRPDFWFVDVLTGPENEGDYTFIGTISRALTTGIEIFRYSSRSPISRDTLSVLAIDWFIRKLSHGQWPVSGTEFWHSGHCGRCGRTLTDPDSISTGLGPVCRSRM